MVMHVRQQAGSLHTALYLRCYPHDPTGMEFHRRAMRRLAQWYGLPAPSEYVDNGLRSRDGLPQLENLVWQIARGRIDMLLIPGPFVFALDDREAADVAHRLRRLGCRLLELPHSRPVRVGPLTRPVPLGGARPAMAPRQRQEVVSLLSRERPPRPTSADGW
ncbi:hypothetical protein [Streptomyces sp. NBC_00273]|uniref:hypothetical protein n=1 Tax=Streptomyces sp. NBC_00273 TaxID=2903644 RepID=UPI002E2E6879|nr:hypothetical protein [Streptomyces sp. NBC_00273]